MPDDLAAENEHLRNLLRQAREMLAQAGYVGVTLESQLIAALSRASEAEHWQRLYAQAVDPAKYDS